MGDINLCSLSWNEPDYRHSTLENIVKDFMIAENCSQLVDQYTRIQSVNGSVQRSCLDHVLTNCPEKFSRP